MDYVIVIKMLSEIRKGEMELEQKAHDLYKRDHYEFGEYVALMDEIEKRLANVHAVQKYYKETINAYMYADWNRYGGTVTKETGRMRRRQVKTACRILDVPVSVVR